MKFLMMSSLVLMSCAKPNYQTLPSDPNILSTPPCTESFNEKKCTLSFSNENICLDLEWEKFQLGKEKGSFYICAYDRTSGVPQNSSRLPFVELYMPSMNHGSTPTQTESPVSTGIYRVKNVFFIMSGEWEIRVQLKEGTNIISQAVLPITVEKK